MSRPGRARLIRSALCLALLGGAAASAVSPPAVRAEVTFSVAPSRVELDAKPGGTGSQVLTVGNGGDEPVELTTIVEPYKGATGDRSAVDWLTPEPASFRLEPGEEQEVTVKVTVPKDLKSGGRYAAVSFTTGAKSVEGSGMAMAGKIGVPFLMKVKGKGEMTQQASLERFAPVMAPDGRIAFLTLLRNEGNLHVLPAGAVEISQGEDDEPLARLDIQQTTAVLPDSEVVLATQGTVPLEASASYRARAVVEYGGEAPVTAEAKFTPKAALAVASTSICENLDRGPTLKVELRNEGDLGLQPAMQLSIRSALGDPRGNAPPLSSVLVWPGDTSEAAVDFPERLTSGEYVLVVQVAVTPPDAEGRVAIPPIEQETAFQIGGLGGDAIPLCPPAADVTDSEG